MTGAVAPMASSCTLSSVVLTWTNLIIIETIKILKERTQLMQFEKMIMIPQFYLQLTIMIDSNSHTAGVRALSDASNFEE